ncbi:beta-glucosidase [Aspergillus lucknowensis]|uniref:Probable beta-glucosidase M n=1 Tax=Aspergillus lucknowensis TaxID=176173 RepID=A0ABR4LIE0_9EURO
MKLTAALLAALQLVSAAPDDAAVAANLERYWSYGRSEAVYPSPEIKGRGAWTTAYEKAQSLVARMTDEEKNNITYGYASTTTGCGGTSGSAPRVGFPGMCLQDAGNGVRGTDLVNAYASGLHVGAAWNRDLAYQRAHYMGAEFRRKGANVALGPVIGPTGRIARGGRNWEGFSNDPYLSGALVGETVSGMQENVIACVKHFVANEQETSRNPPLLLEGSYNQSLSSNIDDRTMHEVYMWAFQDAVKAGAGSIMCSYNRLNNSYGCQNSKTLNGLLKGELGFQGFVVTDWHAQHTGIASAAAGLDMVMPSSKFWENNTLVAAVQNGSLPASRLDDMATRIVAAWYNYAEVENPGHGLPVDVYDPHEQTDARDPKAKDTIFQGAVEGHVLVKNTDNALPLHQPKLLSLFGYDAVAPTLNTAENATFGGWAMGLANTLSWPNASTVSNTALQYMFLSSADPTTQGPGVALNGTLISGAGSGASTPSYIDAPFDAFQRQAYEDNTVLSWDFRSQNPLVNPASDACIVFINEQAAEGWDRPYLADPYSDTLAENVASQCRNTMVVIHNAGVRLVDAWIENPNITALIYAHLPGQDTGRALVEIMYGKQSPSGRLPYTVAKKSADYCGLLDPTMPEADRNGWYPQSNFTEGLYIDYKAFEKEGIEPLYAFGYGLTYTTFEYSDLEIEVVDDDVVEKGYLPPGEEVEEGGLPSLWDVVARVTCTVKNTGSVAAKEVAQLYVGIPGGPAKVLRGFEKRLVKPGESKEFSFELTRRDLSMWDIERQNWGLQGGKYTVYVGKSVADIQLTGRLKIQE